jgi:hypothetical protein
MELWVIRHDWREEMEEWAIWHFIGVTRSPSRPSLRKLRVEYASVILISVGVAGELAIGVEISHINGLIRNKAAEVRTKNGDLREKSNQLVALIHSEAEDERLARVRIEGEVAFRSLNDQQKREIGRKLSRFGNVTGASMWFAMGTPETELFADDIAEALRLAHIHIRPPGGILEAREGGGPWDAPVVQAQTGIVIASTSNPVAHDLAGEIVKEFISLGFDTTRGPDDPPKDNKPPGAVVWVTVQARPKGPQGELKLQMEREAKAKNKATIRK